MRLEYITEYNEAETMELFKEEGREEGKINNLVSLTKKGLLTEEIAAREANMSLGEFRKCEALYGV